ncbi:outer membrane protein assembly factor BamE [Variovorax sp. ZT4R33]|uniref:outer membrane protein assembly factor BamE n=1 Tax=Variovorax sp. ZT4R33 TaxID=3443743 RepID=UPI003F48DC79
MDAAAKEQQVKSNGLGFAPGVDAAERRRPRSLAPGRARLGVAGYLCALAAAALSACGTHVSEGLRDDGEVRQVVFPPIQHATWPDGIFPDRTVLRELEPGVRKAQLLHWFGPPHFSEGIGAVREWDYIFHFYSGGGITTCQYKVLFDSRYVARRFHWRPDACGQWLSPALRPTKSASVAP